MVSLSQVSEIVAAAVTKALDEQKQAADAELANQKQIADDALFAQVEAAKVEKSTGPLYGNADAKQEFDLRKMVGLASLPDDKVVIILPQFNTNGRGERSSVDVKSSAVQFVDPGDYKAFSATDKATGASTYQMLGLEPILVHQPK